MKPFRLDKVLEYRRHQRLEARNALASAISDEQTLIEHQARINRQKGQQLSELAGFTQSEVVNVEAAARRRYFTGQLEIQLMVVAEQLAQARMVVEQMRAVLVKADQEVKALERLHEKHVEEETSLEQKRTEIELSEQWQSANWNW
ncbi:MAG: flagellar FliJ family protein [Planctomycetaceae bacterium]|jgi:flagellar FliJ protein|nr:flagellar FliJ family protein [Planctomycetaceae bacterium]